MPSRDDPADSAVPLTSGRLLARNAAWNLATQCVPMAVALVSMPWLIRGLGPARFGVLTLSWMVLGYFSLFDLGLGRALTKLVAEKIGRGRRDEVPGLVWTALALMTGLGLLGTVVVAVTSPWLVGRFLNLEEPLRGEAVAAFWLMGAALPLVIGTSGLRGVLEAHQKFGGINTVRTATSLFIQLAPLAVLPLTRDLAVVVGVVCLGRLASWIAHVWLCLKTVPGMRDRIALDRAAVRPLLGFGGWMTAVNVINPVMVQMDRFLIAALVSSTAVAYYTTPNELITKAWFLSNAVLGVMFPAFATSFVSDRARTAAIFGRCLEHVGLILFPVVLVAVGLSRELLTIWVGPEFAAQGERVLQWLALGVLLNGLAQVPSALLQGVGRPDLVFRLHLIELGPYLLAAWLLIRGRGIEGAAIAWTGRTALDLLLFSTAAARILPESRAALRRMTAILAACLAALALVALPFGLTYRGIAVLVVGAAALALAWTRVLGAAERAAATARLGSLRDRFAAWATLSGRTRGVAVVDDP